MASTNLGPSPRVLCIPRSDDPDSYVLVHITRTGSTLLDLDITATEGENPYVGTVRQSHLKELRTKNYQGDDEEWKRIVLQVLGQLEDSAGKVNLRQDIESSASIIGARGHEGKEIIITIRKRIQSITLRLGSVTLKQNDQQAIQLFDWSGIAAVRANKLEQRFDSLLARYRSAEDTIRQLNKQLEEFVFARTQHEEQLIVNFVQLLNEKKLKIRNQQHLLASTKADEGKVSDFQNATPGQHLRPSKENRAVKRISGEVSDDGLESEDGFEKMELDQTMRLNNLEADDEQPSTPQPFEEWQNNITGGGESLTPSVSSSSHDERHELEHGRPTNCPVMKEPVPPQKKLPCARKTQTAIEKQKALAHQEEYMEEKSAEETDDDEL
ncbi:hypothetical protein BDV28DRAFT_143340 [Aspergillus coremiiformis]|uniref:Uncharacterized protein n=1 Tax=Aspergillus coremiiformis TaxID=138285 RepID=A0A5N6YST9_9EURO|nr:hypothetical protein BDV28DRAFT_143340 [Aspergillus coremiiformis]